MNADSLAAVIRQKDPRHLINPDQVDIITDKILELDVGVAEVSDIVAIIRAEDMVGMWPLVQVEAIATACHAALGEAAAKPSGGFRR